MRINFRIQIILTIILVIVGFISSLWFKQDIFYNLAWAFTGLVFFIKPLYPENIVRLEQENAEKGIAKILNQPSEMDR